MILIPWCNINPTIIVHNEFLPTNLQTPSRCQQCSCWTCTTSSCTVLHSSRFLQFQWTNSRFIQFQWTSRVYHLGEGQTQAVHNGYNNTYHQMRNSGHVAQQQILSEKKESPALQPPSLLGRLEHCIRTLSASPCYSLRASRKVHPVGLVHCTKDLNPRCQPLAMLGDIGKPARAESC